MQKDRQDEVHVCQLDDWVEDTIFVSSLGLTDCFQAFSDVHSG